MASEHILRIPRSDSEGDFVLINVHKGGSSDLDLRFVATEGENPYVGSLKASQISKIRAKNYRGTDEEWSRILSFVFVQKEQPAESTEEWKSGLEVVAAVKGGVDDEDSHEITITFRKRIDSITQRLGSVTLKQDDDQAIQLFDWAGTAVQRADTLAQEISDLRTKYKSAEDTISQLNSRLEELVQAKNEHDDQLIAKFAKLLNEKKLKIRNQQRLLATADVNSAKLAEMEAASAGKKPRKPAASRKTKRKAAEPPPDSESEDAFETMEIDNNAKNQTKDIPVDDEATASESEKPSTPEPLEDETASGDDDEEEEEDVRPPPGPPSRRTRQASQGPANNPPSAPPPRRELPFARRNGREASNPPAKSKEPQRPANNDDGDTTSSDDEL